MPVGPFPTHDACLTGLKEAYPDEATRKKVCGAMAARTHTAAGDAAHDHAALHVDAARAAGKVVRGPGYVLIRDAVGTKAGVNDNAQWKPPEAIRDGWQSFDGVPLVFGHPKTQSRAVEDHAAVAGFAVNTRLREADMAIVRDLLLFTERPPGFTTTDEDLARAERMAGLVDAGVPIHLSEGYFAPGKYAQAGVAAGQDGRARAYALVQPRLVGDHLAILSPLVPGVPGSCPVPICGAGVDAAMPEAATDAELEAAAKGGQWTKFIDSFRGLLRKDAKAMVDECAKEKFPGLDAGKKTPKENPDMDEKQVAALAAQTAEKAVADALKPIQEQLKPLADLKALGDGLKAMQDQLNAQKQAEGDAAKAEVHGVATKLARLRLGATADAAKIKAEADRLVTLFPSKAAIDEVFEAQAAPGHIDPTLITGPVKTEGPYARNPDGTWAVQDWAKVPRTQDLNRGFGKPQAPSTPAQGAS